MGRDTTIRLEPMNPKTAIIIVALCVGVVMSLVGTGPDRSMSPPTAPAPVPPPQIAQMPVAVPVANTGPTDALLGQAYQQRWNNYQMGGVARVSRVLPDDNDGGRHQKFIIQTAPGQTVLIAHNIDLAPRIPTLQVGDIIEFFGEYEWNEKGGVIHWTHHDPANRHAHGWLKHNGAVYQ